MLIVKPRNGDSFLLDPLIPNADEKIIFEARGTDDALMWFVDDDSIGMGEGPDHRIEWTPVVGRHEVRVLSHPLTPDPSPYRERGDSRSEWDEGGGSTDSIVIEVIE